MKPTCRKIQQTLAERGARALCDDEPAQQHVAECDACFLFLESLTEIDAGLESMARLDVSDEVVESLLARPEITAGTPSVGESSVFDRIAALLATWLRPRPLAWASVAGAFLLIAVAVGLRFDAPASNRDALLVGTPEASDTQDKLERKVKDAELDEAQSSDKRPLEKKGFVDEFRQDQVHDLPVPDSYFREVPTPAPDDAEPRFGDDANVHGSRDRDFKAVVGGVSNVDPAEYEPNAPTSQGAGRANVNSIEELEVIARVTSPVLIESSRVKPSHPEPARTARIEARVLLQVIVRADGSVTDATVLECDRPELGFEQAAIDAVSQWRYEPAKEGDQAVDVYWTIELDFDGEENGAAPESRLLRPDDAVRTAQAFLEERSSIEGLEFRPARGYWSNAYVPGDPALRWLQSRLAGWDRSATEAYLPVPGRLHDAARRVGQPFDTPDDSALAVYVQADRRGLIEEERMLIQVGIEGTPRHAGRRPAMNLALVVDLRDEITTEVAIGVRSLLDAFNRAQEPGDRFRLFVAGRAGGCVVRSEDFRHGFLRVALDRLLASPSVGLGLVDATRAAIESVAAADDPDTPLGSSAVVLITGGTIGSEARKLAGIAHRGAVAGAPLSVVGIGPSIDPDEIERLTLAGQGQRLLLDDPARAAELVDRELAAASRAVARAVRLRIRFAPGVRLVDVLGSERLDEERAQRVRDSERSIDLRLSRALGIEADRGEDEEGIQIVIPTFYAGDSHVILLDVVASGPGPIVDVTARYKDLVRLQNGVTRASLSLARDARQAGPLERNVLKNLLSRQLSRALGDAGDSLHEGGTARAVACLRDAALLLDGLRRDVPGLDNDPDLLRDIAMLGEYRTLLGSGFTGLPDQRAYLADSLRYAARLKVLPRPLETTS